MRVMTIEEEVMVVMMILLVDHLPRLLLLTFLVSVLNISVRMPPISSAGFSMAMMVMGDR